MKVGKRAEHSVDPQRSKKASKQFEDEIKRERGHDFERGSRVEYMGEIGRRDVGGV